MIQSLKFSCSYLKKNNKFNDNNILYSTYRFEVMELKNSKKIYDY